MEKKRRGEKSLAVAAFLAVPENAALSNVEIGRRLGCTDDCVQEVRRALVGRRPMPQMETISRREIQKFLEAPDHFEMTDHAIAHLFGCHHSTVGRARSLMPEYLDRPKYQYRIRHEIVRFLALPETARMSNAEVARHLGVHRSTVAHARKSCPYGATTRLRLDHIRLDGVPPLGPRRDDAEIEKIADAIVRGDAVPPVAVFHDGTNHWLADGFLRVQAYRLAGKETIETVVHMGGAREATLYAVRAAAGRPKRAYVVKRNQIEILLRDDVWREWGNRTIAKICCVSPSTVFRVRHQFALLPRSR